MWEICPFHLARARGECDKIANVANVKSVVTAHQADGWQGLTREIGDGAEIDDERALVGARMANLRHGGDRKRGEIKGPTDHLKPAVSQERAAERKAGELLAGMDLKSKSQRANDRVSLADIGITGKQSSRWQRAATRMSAWVDCGDIGATGCR